MGITIHYNGQIADPSTLPALVEELSDIAQAMGWPCTRIGDDEEAPAFQGILINPPDCELLAFVFDRDGRLRTVADLVTGQVEPDPRYSYFVSVKTQFGTIETHTWIVGLLRYLKTRYFAELTVHDEGGYWKTSDADELAKKRAFLSSMIDQFSSDLPKGKSDNPAIQAVIDEIRRMG